MKSIFFRYVFLGMLICVFSCSSRKESGKNGKLTIIYSGNIGARYDPCGCRPPIGGQARRSTVIKGIKDNTDDVLVLDTGALIFEKRQLYPPYEPTMRMTAHMMIDILNRMDMDAVNVSSMDMADGPDSLLAYDAASNWPFLSANVVRKDSGELIFRPDIIKMVGEFRVGIFGFMDQASMGIPFFDESSPVAVLDPVEASKKEVKKLKDEGVDLIIALAYMDRDSVENLLDVVSGINLIIFGHTHEHNPSSDPSHFLPYKPNKTIIARCPDGGRVLGVMELEIWNGSTEFANTVGMVDLRPEAVKKDEDPRNKKSIFSNTFIHLDPSIERDRAIQDQLDEIGGRIEDLRKRLKKESEKT